MDIIITIWNFLKEYDTLLTVIGFFITLWTFVKVSSLKKAQEKYDGLVEIDNLKELLSRISFYLTSNMPQNDVEISKIQQEIQRSIGKIEGVKSALFNSKKSGDLDKSSVFISEGYYSDAFLTERINETKLRLCIFAKRNQRLSNMDHLLNIGKLLRKSKNCTIELMAISPESSDDILLEMNKTIPIAAANLTKLKEELIENRERILRFKDSLTDSEKERFHYYEYLGLPPFHCVQVDDFLYFGLVNYHKLPTEYQVVENRPCIKFDLKSVDFAQRIKVQFEKFVDECKQNGREY